MDYENLVRDFAKRTRHNLQIIRGLRSSQSAETVYEVTQLVNSMLGLLVFPQQRYVRRIPETPVAELAQLGWPIPTVEGSYPQVDNLRQLVRYLRNAIAHFNIEFTTDERDQLNGVRVWNSRNGNILWKARLSLADLEGITERFISMLLEEEIGAA